MKSPIQLICLALLTLVGCDSSDKVVPEKHGNVLVRTTGLEGFMSLSMNGGDPDLVTHHQSDGFARTTSYTVMQKTLKEGVTVDFQIVEQSDNSYCEFVADQNFVFDPIDNSIFDVQCIPFETGINPVINFDTSETHTCALFDNGLDCFSDSPELRRVPTGLRENTELVKTGFGFSCAVQNNAITCWGDSNSTEEGFLDAPTPTIVGDLKELELGFSNGCLIDDEGLKCWGHESSDVALNYPRNLTAPSNLIVKGSNACVLDDGKAHCWGYNWTEGDIPETEQIITDIDVSSISICAIANSQVLCWSDNDDWPTLRIPNDLGTASEIYLGDFTACAKTENGLRCWGTEHGALTLTDKIIPYADNVVLDHTHGCAINEGELICFGVGSRGQLGLLF